MSDQQPEGRQPRNTGDDAQSWIEPGQKNAQLVYILYLVSMAIGISVLVGLVFAYMNRGKSEEWIDSHYTYAIRTFWIGIVYSIICLVLAFVGIGFLLMIAAAAWFIIRCIKGLQAIGRNESITDPLTWLV